MSNIAHKKNIYIYIYIYIYMFALHLLRDLFKKPSHIKSFGPYKFHQGGNFSFPISLKTTVLHLREN